MHWLPPSWGRAVGRKRTDPLGAWQAMALGHGFSSRSSRAQVLLGNVRGSFPARRAMRRLTGFSVLDRTMGRLGGRAMRLLAGPASGLTRDGKQL